MTIIKTVFAFHWVYKKGLTQVSIAGSKKKILTPACDLTHIPTPNGPSNQGLGKVLENNNSVPTSFFCLAT